MVSLHPAYEVEERYSYATGEFSRLLKLDDTHFLASRPQGDAYIFHAESTNIVKKYDSIGSKGYNVKLILSKQYESCFYYNLEDKFSSIHLASWEHHRIEKVFQLHAPGGESHRKAWKGTVDIDTIAIFKNRRNDEMLVAAESLITFYIFNTTSTIYNKRIKLCDFARTKKRVKRKRAVQDQVSDSFFHKNQYLCCVSSRGSVCMFELDEEQDGLKRLRDGERVGKHVHRGWIYEVQALFSTKKSMQILTCGDDGEMNLTRIDGLQVKEMVYDIDEGERIQFLLESKNSYIFNEDTKKRMVFGIKTCNISIEEVFRSLISIEVFEM